MAEAQEVFLKNAPGPDKVQIGTVSKQDEGGYLADCALCARSFVGKQKQAKSLLQTHFVATHSTIGV